MSDALAAMKALREARGPIPERLKAMQKAQRQYQKAIASALAEGPKTVPELATETGLESALLFWHINAMRKYGFVATQGQKGQYLSYALVKQ